MQQKKDFYQKVITREKEITNELQEVRVQYRKFLSEAEKQAQEEQISKLEDGLKKE
ncbi:MAG: hypothetical protein WCK01_03640 [Candidatus Uhrbacteria bacterium]